MWTRGIPDGRISAFECRGRAPDAASGRWAGALGRETGRGEADQRRLSWAVISVTWLKIARRSFMSSLIFLYAYITVV